jgi:hypothetical protein
MVIPDKASSQLKDYYAEKERIFRESLASLKTLKKANAVVQEKQRIIDEQTVMVQEKQTMIDEQTKMVQEKQRIIDEQTIKLSNVRPTQMLALLLGTNRYIPLKVGEFTFGSLGPDQPTHYFIAIDEEMDDNHFALQVAYNISATEKYRCKIKNNSRTKQLLVNNMPVSDSWDILRPGYVIIAGKTEITLLVSTK